MLCVLHVYTVYVYLWHVDQELSPRLIRSRARPCPLLSGTPEDRPQSGPATRCHQPFTKSLRRSGPKALPETRRPRREGRPKGGSHGPSARHPERDVLCHDCKRPQEKHGIQEARLVQVLESVGCDPHCAQAASTKR